MLTEVGSVFDQLLTWMGSFLTELTGETGGLKPLLALFALGIGIALIRALIGLVRNLTWGA